MMIVNVSTYPVHVKKHDKTNDMWLKCKNLPKPHLKEIIIYFQLIYLKVSFLVPGSSLCLGILSDQQFTALEGKVCEATLMGVKDMGFTTMTEIQVQNKLH